MLADGASAETILSDFPIWNVRIFRLRRASPQDDQVSA